MTANVQIFILMTILPWIQAVSIWEQLNHMNRRVFELNRYEGGGTILGVPSRPSHLPAAEHVLPGHTLIRPAIGMLKSAVKFPHRENENGEGVYGNQNNLGIRYDGRNERLLYSGFRRMPRNYNMDIFDHININPNAIEFSEFLPSVTEKSKPWSYYHKEEKWRAAKRALFVSLFITGALQNSEEWQPQEIKTMPCGNESLSICKM